MTKEYLDTIEKKAVALLKTLSDDLTAASKDRCSEVARLVGCWILKDYPNVKAVILKGELENGLAHDVLALTDGNQTHIIDPTIWQIYPESQSILVGGIEAGNEISFLANKYGGNWKVSEVLKVCTPEEEQSLLGTINK